MKVSKMNLVELDKLIKSSYNYRGDEKLEAISDGLLNESKYLSSKIKVMWVLKEPYDDFDENGNPKGGGWSFGDAFKDKHCKQDFSIQSMSTYDPMFYIMYSINNGFKEWEDLPWSKNTSEMVNFFKSISYVNISKFPGGKNSESTPLQNIYENNKELLFLQIETYNPDVIIFGNTFKYFQEDMKIEMAKNNGFGSGILQNRLLIDAYHPSQRKASTGISKEEYINGIINLIKNKYE